jgi:hypothetical protein
MVRIDVDDEHVIELALLRLLAGVGEQPGGIELFDRHAATAVGDEVHGASPAIYAERQLNCTRTAVPAKACNPSARIESVGLQTANAA